MLQNVTNTEELINTELEEWYKDGERLKQEIIDYNWKYRRKVCSKCPIETQKKLDCFKLGNFKIGIQETHCSKLIRSRTNYFRKKIQSFFNLEPLESLQKVL